MILLDVRLPVFMIRYLFNRMCIPQRTVLGTDQLTSRFLLDVCCSTVHEDMAEFSSLSDTQLCNCW